MQGEDGHKEARNPAAASAQALLSLYLLLLAFFILLQSISTFEDQRAGEVMEGVNRSFPSFLRSGTVGGDRMARGGLAEGAEASARLGPLFEAYFTLSPTASMIAADRYRVAVPLADLFAGQGEALNPRIDAFLDQLADILQRPPAGARIELELLIPEPAAQLRGEAGSAGTHHQHVAMGVARGVAVGIRLLRRDAEPGRGADDRLVEPLPRRLRPHEGLVVEPGRKQRRGEIVERADVEAERGPAVLRHGGEAVVKLLHGGAHVGRRAPGVAADADQRVRLLGAGGKHAARPVILERAAHQVNAVGQQRGSQRVALQPGMGDPVEGKARHARRRQPALAGDAEGAAHASSSFIAGFFAPAL